MPLIPGAAEALRAARKAGAWTANLSGAGSGILALTPREKAEEVAMAMASELEKRDGPAGIQVARVWREGASLIRP